MKLIIQIPCLNEQDTLAATVADLPRQINGVDVIEYLVIDDGSTDRTAEVAAAAGVHHVLRLGSNRGLAFAFARGIEYAVMRGADIVVNTDADNQYAGSDIPRLVVPILQGQADLVVGCRPIADHPEFGPLKKLLQMAGSAALRVMSKTTVRDAASGFRAFSRETCQRIFIHSKFSYCMETLIQAGNSGLRVASVDIHVNPKTRDSRLFKSIPQYIRKSGGTMATMFVLYRPGMFFFIIGTMVLLPATIMGARFFYLAYLANPPAPRGSHIASLVVFSVLSMASVMLYALGVLGEISKWQRRIAEEGVYLQRRQMQRIA